MSMLKIYALFIAGFLLILSVESCGSEIEPAAIYGVLIND